MHLIVKRNPDGFRPVRTIAEALAISAGDMAGPVLVELGVIHRRQQNRIFATEGAAGGSGRWPALNPSYAARKRARYGRKKILQLTGDTKDRFTKPTNIGYVQRFVPRGTSGSGLFQFGAYSTVAAAHYFGNPLLVRLRSRSSRILFGGVAKRLPVRDLITKKAAMVDGFNFGLNTWYQKRVAQVLRNHGPRIRASRPR